MTSSRGQLVRDVICFFKSRRFVKNFRASRLGLESGGGQPRLSVAVPLNLPQGGRTSYREDSTSRRGLDDSDHAEGPISPDPDPELPDIFNQKRKTRPSRRRRDPPGSRDLPPPMGEEPERSAEGGRGAEEGADLPNGGQRALRLGMVKSGQRLRRPPHQPRVLGQALAEEPQRTRRSARGTGPGGRVVVRRRTDSESASASGRRGTPGHDILDRLLAFRRAASLAHGRRDDSSFQSMSSQTCLAAATDVAPNMHFHRARRWLTSA